MKVVLEWIVTGSVVLGVRGGGTGTGICFHCSLRHHRKSLYHAVMSNTRI